MLWAGRLDKNMAARKRHSPEQVVGKLATADRMLGEGKDVADVCRELAISEQTSDRWRNRFGGLKADDAKRLKDLEREDAALKRLLADAELERAALKEIAREPSTPGTPAGGRRAPHRRDGRAGTVRLPRDRAEPNHPAKAAHADDTTPIRTPDYAPGCGRGVAKDHPRRGFRNAW
jgi:putative transposase